MGLWPKRAAESVSHAREAAPWSFPAVSWSGTMWNEARGLSELWAMQVPAFNRGVRLISGTVAQLPLEGAGQLDEHRPNWVTMQRTIRDLILHGKAYWLRQPGIHQTEVFEHVSFTDVAESPDGKSAVVNGTSGVTVSNPAVHGVQDAVRLIKFDGFTDGVLLTGVDTITTALAQETAARNYSEAPAPTQILKNTSNYELDDTEITELITAYQSARQNSAVAYLNGGVDLTTFGYSAHDLQLVEARNQSAIQIARLLNLDPFWVGAGVPGSALTYQNRVDMRQDLVDLTLSDYITAVEQRLSMPDVYPEGVRFDTTEFLRANLDTRARIAIDLFTAGVIDRGEAREFINDQPTGGPT